MKGEGFSSSLKHFVNISTYEWIGNTSQSSWNQIGDHCIFEKKGFLTKSP